MPSIIKLSNMRRNTFNFLVLLLVVGSIFSCKKKSKEEDQDTNSASENFLATGMGNDMSNVSDEAAKTYAVNSFKSSEQLSILSACATVSVDTVATGTNTIIVNFGAANCLCNDGRYRRGSLKITFTGKYKDSLANISITPVNYFVNDHGISGTKTIRNLGHNSAGHLIYEMNENLTIAKAQGGTIVYYGVRRREVLSGENTPQWNDDRYALTGSASGYNSNGRSFTSSITSPLIRDMSAACRRHFIQGVLVHTPDSKPDRIVDFGNGACDNKATISINDKTYEVELP